MAILLRRTVLVLVACCTSIALGAASTLLAEGPEAEAVYCEKDKCYGGNECRDAGTDQTGCQEYGPLGAFCKSYDCPAT